MEVKINLSIQVMPINPSEHNSIPPNVKKQDPRFFCDDCKAMNGAVEQITKVLAKELGQKRITVNSISPGPVDTELFRRGKSEKQIKDLADMAGFVHHGARRERRTWVADTVIELLGVPLRSIAKECLSGNRKAFIHDCSSPDQAL